MKNTLEHKRYSSSRNPVPKRLLNYILALKMIHLIIQDNKKTKQKKPKNFNYKGTHLESSFMDKLVNL